MAIILYPSTKLMSDYFLASLNHGVLFNLSNCTINYTMLNTAASWV